MTKDDNRRPLKSRNTGWAYWLTRRLAATSITPNQISILSIPFAAISGLLFTLSADAEGGTRMAILITAAVLCQLRLLCNLMDGLVAIEAGKSAPDGPFWNEFPDRIADIAILVGVGYAAANPMLGWIAATLAIFTAYIRELGCSNGLPADFTGPMAKPHRMAMVTLGSIIALFEPLWWSDNMVFIIVLWLIILGTIITCARRAWRLVIQLNNRK